jgi:hypothetical protein
MGIVLALGGLIGGWWLAWKWLRNSHWLVRHGVGALTGTFLSFVAVGAALATDVWKPAPPTFAASVTTSPLVSAPPEARLTPKPLAAAAASVQPAASEPSAPAASAAAVLTAAASAKPSPPEAAIGSLAALRGYLEKLGMNFNIKPLLDGTPRVLGQTEDKQTICELYPAANGGLAHGSITVAMDPDNKDARLRNAVAVSVFMRETGWLEGASWAADAIKKGGAKKTHGRVAYELNQIMPGMPLYLITAKASL